MKKNLMTLLVALFTWTGMSAMDYETAREHAYYLTDKMAYELNLNDQQYNDAYEINLDYLLSLNTEADLADARYLTYRNDDLRHILYDWQWTAFAAVDYLFRPVWWLSGGWYFPVFRHYAHGYYFYHRPSIFWDYRGGHGRFYFTHGFYHDRRPMWHGGLRGMHHDMVGHPNPGGGRYGHPGGGPGHDNRGRGYSFERNGRTPVMNGNGRNGGRPNMGNLPSSSRTTVGRGTADRSAGTATRSTTGSGSRATTGGTFSSRSGNQRGGTPSLGGNTRSSGSSRSAGSFSGGSTRGGGSFGGGRSAAGGTRGGSFGGGRSATGGTRGGSFGGGRGAAGGTRGMGGSSRGSGRR